MTLLLLAAGLVALCFFAGAVPFGRIRLSLARRPSADWLRGEAGRLASAGAQWEEILSALNPASDVQVHALLMELRGPHMFVPLTGLRVIQVGCESALKLDASASSLAALREAVKSSDAVTTFGR